MPKFYAPLFWVFLLKNIGSLIDNYFKYIRFATKRKT